MVPTIIWRGLIVFASLKKSENCGSCVTEVTLLLRVHAQVQMEARGQAVRFMEWLWESDLLCS